MHETLGTGAGAAAAAYAAPGFVGLLPGAGVSASLAQPLPVLSRPGEEGLCGGGDPGRECGCAGGGGGGTVQVCPLQARVAAPVGFWG